MLEWVLAGAIGVAQPRQELPDLDVLKTCVAHVLAVETAIEEGHWASVPGAELPQPGSWSRASSFILLIDALAKAAEREGVDVASLRPGIEAKAAEAPRAQSAEDVAMALERESDCFRLLNVGEPED